MTKRMSSMYYGTSARNWLELCDNLNNNSRGDVRISSLRVRPKSSRDFAKSSKHQPNGRQAKERHGGPI
jgi:hypothetical protein